MGPNQWLPLAVLTLLAAPATAADCPIGATVQLKGGSTGTLAEVGTQPPHIGWYRITFSWSPGGEWYDPKTWEVSRTGTGERCLPGSSSRPPLAATPRPAPQEGLSGSATASGPSSGTAGSCPFNEPRGPVNASSPPTAATFQRVIYERKAGTINPGSISGLKRYGVTFQSFTLGDSYVNKVFVVPGQGARRIHDGAPPNATIYTMTARMLECEGYGREVRRTVKEGTIECFISRSGSWTCPPKGMKTIETRLYEP